MHRALARRRTEREHAIDMASAYLSRLDGLLEGFVAGVLHGSYARGDFHWGSDIDVLVIAEGLPAHPLRRLDLLYACVEGRIEPKGYSKEEFIGLMHARNPIAIDALKNGVVLLDRGFWGEVQEKFETMDGAGNKS